MKLIVQELQGTTMTNSSQVSGVTLSPRLRRRAASFCALVVAVVAPWPTAVQAGDFTPSETLVSPLKIVDAEYSQSRAEFAWADSAGRLWVGKIDPATGLFVKPHGKSVLVDADALSLGDIKQTTGTGPEWIKTAAGDQIVYTKFLAGLPHTPENARIALAQPGATGNWAVGFLDTQRTRMGPYGSEDPGDTAPRITYVDEFGNHYLREIGNPASEQILPFIRTVPLAVRQARGDRSLVFTAQVGDLFQVFRYQIDTQALDQLTFDDGGKDRATVPWMWRAPEFGNELVLMTIVNYVELRIYRAPAGGAGPWVPIYSATLPTGGKIGSPEPFTYNGKSFVYFDSTVEPNRYPTQVWLSNIVATSPALRLLSDDTQFRARIDPELFISRKGPYIYFNRYDPSKSPLPGSPFCDACSEGVYRVFTGLPPPR